MRRFIIAMAIVTIGVGPVLGYEVQLSGNYCWSYESAVQLGNDGFFGLYDVDRSGQDGGIGYYAPYNGWLGYRLRISSGSKGSQALMSATFYPHVKINPSVGVTGRYRIAPWNIWNGENYLVGTSQGVGVPLATGHWTLWSLYARTPWGTVFYGKRPLEVGCGLQYDGTSNTTDESLVLRADYGPLAIGLGFMPWYDGREITTGVYPGWSWPWVGETLYGNRTDNNRTVTYRIRASVTYANATSEFGVGCIDTSLHQGPELSPATPWANYRYQVPPVDTHINEGWAYLKFNNGRAFFNTELDWYSRMDKVGRSLDGTFNGTPENTDGGGSIFAPKYIESWRWMAELGVISGPAKATLFYAYLPGRDLRHGIFVSKQPRVQDGILTNATMFSQYSMLLSGSYGAGINAVDVSWNPYMNEASCVAARIDYSLAANLNLFATGFHATRTSHGYGWGFLNLGLYSFEEYAVYHRLRGTFTEPCPTIPDNDLGWEVNVGVGWDFLDSWNFTARFGYWRPGRWFNYACIDRGVQDWDTPGPANNWGVNPNRKIDPVIGLFMQMTTNF